MFRSTWKLPAVNHVHAVETERRSPGERLHIVKNETAAAAKAPAVVTIEIQAATRREIAVPSSVITTAPSSGNQRHTHAACVTGSSAQRRQLVDGEVELPPRHRDDQP